MRSLFACSVRAFFQFFLRSCSCRQGRPSTPLSATKQPPPKSHQPHRSKLLSLTVHMHRQMKTTCENRKKSTYLTRSINRFFARRHSFKRPPQTGQRTSLSQLGGLGSAVSSPSGVWRPQTHFETFQTLKTHLMATDAQHFRVVWTSNLPPEPPPPVCYFYFPQLFSQSILLPPVNVSGRP